MEEEFGSRFLSFLETREQRLLSWGFYDVCFSPGEIVSLIEDEGDESLKSEWHALAQGPEAWSIEDFVAELAAANLLFQVDDSRYRSRFAETVRMIARLKQMFREDQWATGPNLVSDIKLNLKPRRYPRRDQPAKSCWETMGVVASKPELQKSLFTCLSTNPTTGKAFDYSSFQRRAFAHILGQYSKNDVSGSVVCAGTGAGKTKAFYVPAILSAATELSETPFTKIVAIYPRNVLLADQLREALAETMKLNDVLSANRIRPFRLGALLGGTPFEGWFNKTDSRTGKRQVEKYGGWRRIGQSSDFVVPFLKSPLDAGQDLVWRENDRKAGRTCLYHVGSTAPQPAVPDGMLSLTREQLIQSPPDFLFLSVEMLNRELGNPEWEKTFGIGRKKLSPRLLLLDEVHSYEGIHGAQVAWVLRRWRHATASRRLHVVGLSATLKQAPEHIARVTGVSSANVVEFRPSDQECKDEGIEYNLAIKGDPAAGTSLLSTTIQCGMALARTLTPNNYIPRDFDFPVRPEKLFTRKVFGFTDNLDVVNRWLSDMADAERQRLARLRLHPGHQHPEPVPMPTDDELARRDQQGQLWELPRRLGFDLNQPLQVGRCSSQDPGLQADDDLVIATSSLEVGFDDPTVGAVIQHKRPMSIASFIQRKGRAGRTRGSRPWTLVVLSDYGADRFAFQQAEQLFEPELDQINLPYRNQYVLRIQATFFLLDWLGRRIGLSSPFRYFQTPRPHAEDLTYNAKERKAAKQILQDMLRQGTEWKAFREAALKLFSGPLSGPLQRLKDSQVDSIFWELPRPLLRQVIPCLLRKLERDWEYADPRRHHVNEGDPASGVQRENSGVTYPLPEFLPSATFADLEITETRITFDTGSRWAKDDEFLDVSQVLRETCPGRSSKRFSIRAGDPGFWHDNSEQLVDGANQVNVVAIYPNALDIGTVDGLRIFQPETVPVRYRPSHVLDSSYGSWRWRSHFRPFGTGYDVPVFSISPWKDVVTSCRTYLHRDQSGVDVTRFANEFDFEVRPRRGAPTIGRGILNGTFQDDEYPAAVGFQRRVDAIELRILSGHLLNIPELPTHLIARFRSDYYLHRLRTHEGLPPAINGFLRERIWQISLAMLTATSLHNDCSMEESQQLLQNRTPAVERVLGAIFQMQDPALPGDDGRLIESIREAWQHPRVITVVQELETLLWEPLDQEFYEWVRQRYVATIAQAFRATAVSTDLEVNDDDLLIDVIHDPGGPIIYLSETQSGGLGVIEKIVQELSSDPNRFHNGMRHMLVDCQRNKTTEYLIGVLSELPSNVSLSDAFSKVRSTKGFGGQRTAKDSLQAALLATGFDATRARFVALMSKVLHPGTSPTTDDLMRLLNREWHATEQSLSVGIDPRVYAYSALRNDTIREGVDRHFQQLHGLTNPNDVQRYSAVERSLLPVCRDSCPECLSQSNMYNDFGIPSRELASVWLETTTSTICVGNPNENWEAEVRSVLASEGLVTVEFSADISAEITPRMHELFAIEMDVGVLFYPISIQRLEKSGKSWRLTLQLKDLIHD